MCAATRNKQPQTRTHTHPIDRPTCPCKAGSRKCHTHVRLFCSYISVSCDAHTTWGWQDEEARLAQAHQPSWCLPLRFLCMSPVPLRGTQKHVFVLTPCFEITCKLFTPSVGLLLGPFHTHSHHLRLRVCCCSRCCSRCCSQRRRETNQGGARRERRIDVANNIQAHKAYTMRVATRGAIHTRTTHAQSDIDDASGEDSETGDKRGKNNTMLLALTASLNRVRPTLDTCNWSISGRANNLSHMSSLASSMLTTALPPLPPFIACDPIRYVGPPTGKHTV